MANSPLMTRVSYRFVNIPGKSWDLTLNTADTEVVIGTAAETECIMQVGNGEKTHYGHRIVGTVTVPFDSVNKFGNVDKHHEVGEQISWEPQNRCGASANLRFHGYSTGWRNNNRVLDEGTKVTCTQCIRKYGSN